MGAAYDMKKNFFLKVSLSSNVSGAYRVENDFSTLQTKNNTCAPLGLAKINRKVFLAYYFLNPTYDFQKFHINLFPDWS